MAHDRDVEAAGLSAVASWLKENGWEVLVPADPSEGPTGISASKEGKAIVVGVKSSIYPADPGSMTPDESERIKVFARCNEANPKLARVWLNEDLTLKDGIVMWSRIE